MEKLGKRERATRDEAEQILRKKFFYYYKSFINEEKYYYSLKNHKWDKAEWEEKIIEIQVWTLRYLEYQIPSPNEEGYNQPFSRH